MGGRQARRNGAKQLAVGVWRLRLGLEAVQGPYRIGAQLQHSASQERVPSKDVPTPASTQLGLSASWERALQTGSAALSLLWYFKLDNLTNALVYNASALRTARELAPGGARAVTAGLRVGF